MRGNHPGWIGPAMSSPPALPRNSLLHAYPTEDYATSRAKSQAENVSMYSVQVTSMPRYRLQYSYPQVSVPAFSLRVAGRDACLGYKPTQPRTCEIHACFIIDYITDLGDISSVLSPPPSASAGITPDASQLIVTTGRIKPQ